MVIEVGTDREGHSLRLLVWQGLKQYSTKALFQFLYDRDAIVRSATARELQIRGGKLVFEKTMRLLTSDSKNIRELAAFIHGQLGTPKRPFKAESTKLLLQLLHSETNASVRASAICSLGSLHATRASRKIASFAKDPSPSVRGSVAFAVGMIYCEKRASIPGSLWRLLNKLRKDNSREVRDMAMLGLDLVLGERRK